jgi:hypothetical protein
VSLYFKKMHTTDKLDQTKHKLLHSAPQALGREKSLLDSAQVFSEKIDFITWDSLT